MNVRHTLEATGKPGDGWRQGCVVALVAVVAATLVAAPLYFFVSLPSLMLPYVLAIVVTGLRQGSGPALLAAALGLFAHNFFYTTPNFNFGLPHEDDVYSLLFLSLIALACGPVASQIRRQFIELHQSNRYLEALHLLGQDLSVAEDVPAVLEATVRELEGALQAECRIVHWPAAEADVHPALPALPEAVMQLAGNSRESALPAGQHALQSGEPGWNAWPLIQEGRVVAVCLLKFPPALTQLPDFERRLIEAVLHQSAATLGRIALARELEHARVQAGVEQLRSAMLASVSHDLKTPLAAIMGAAESVSLLDRQLSAEDRLELMSMIWSESHRLDTYIQNLLDMTRLENGALRIERDWVSADDLVGSAMSRLKRYFPGVHIRCEMAAEPPLLYVNPALFEQALYNIIENAARYSPPDESVVISVSSGERCRITVEDRGPGIPEALLEQVFDMFFVIAEGDQAQPGTGVGLAICRGIVMAHDGTVRAERRAQGGTVFVVEMPLVYPDEEATAGSEEQT